MNSVFSGTPLCFETGINLLKLSVLKVLGHFDELFKIRGIFSISPLVDQVSPKVEMISC